MDFAPSFSMRPSVLTDQTIDYNELVQRFGPDNARDILRTLERMNGICEELVAAWSYEDRLANVFLTMKSSPDETSHTRH